MAWAASTTTEFDAWFGDLPDDQQDAVVAAVDALKLVGPTLGRPLVDRLKGSAIHNLKELRPRGGGKNIRILFAFDPNRAAVLLLGGDKAGQWDSWYKTAIPRAEQLYRHHLQQSGPDTGQANQ